LANQSWRGQLGAASRGLVIREWNAVLNGQKVDRPAISLFSTHHRKPGMLAEIGAPEGLSLLRKGDFIEMRVEVVLVPKYPDHYLGTNEALKKSLPETADTWKAVYRQAIGNDVEIAASVGTFERNYPVEILIDDTGVAEFEVTGGLAYMPVTFSGIKTTASCTLYEVIGGKQLKVDQSDHGNDFWQAVYDPSTGLYRITYNIGLDSPGDIRTVRHFLFKSN